MSPYRTTRSTLPSQIDPADLTELILDCHQLTSLTPAVPARQRQRPAAPSVVIDARVVAILDGMSSYGD